jgi:hypothetical protein
MPDYVEADRAREIVRDAYKGDKWKKKVDCMSDRQVYAIFLSMSERNEKKRKERVREVSDAHKKYKKDYPDWKPFGEKFPKVKPQPIKISCGEPTPFMMSELERLRNGGFRSIKEVQEERRLNNNGYLQIKT